MTKVIVGFGEALVDVLPSGEVVGGAPLNFAVRAAELAQPLGWSAALISRIGSDERGQKVLNHLQQTTWTPPRSRSMEHIPPALLT
jgi:fructokinase